jgi:hypothetical protein
MNYERVRTILIVMMIRFAQRAITSLRPRSPSTGSSIGES